MSKKGKGKGKGKGKKDKREDKRLTLKKGRIIQERAKRVLAWGREEECSNPVATAGSLQALVAREKRLLVAINYICGCNL